MNLPLRTPLLTEYLPVSLMLTRLSQIITNLLLLLLLVLLVLVYYSVEALYKVDQANRSIRVLFSTFYIFLLICMIE